MTALVRPGRANVRPSAKKPPTMRSFSWPAPTGGLMANGNLAAAQPGYAYVLENYFCTAMGAVVRRGCQKKMVLDGGASPTRTIFSYMSGNIRKLFAVNDTNIYDVTASTPSAIASSTSGKWIFIQFQASDGSTYLRGVNGADAALVFDGTAFSTAPALTFPAGVSLTSGDLNFVWSHKNRHFFIQKNSQNAWYLPVGQMGGELAAFPLGGIFKLGGSLIMGATWSRDTGSGLNAMCAFFSSEGEVAIYEGSNPGDTADWTLVGVFRIGRPLGPKSIIEAGGDLMIATDIGFIPLSRALNTDYSILGIEAISGSIIDLWNDEVGYREGGDWNVVFWPRRQMVAVALPTINEQPAKWLVANAKTKAWSTFSNWDATCVHVFGNECYFGGPNGEVFEAYVTGYDNKQPFTATVVPMFDQMEVAGYKTMSMSRAVFRGPNPVREKITDQTDYQINLPSAPSASPVVLASTWDNAVWDVDAWADPTSAKNMYQRWRPVTGAGEVHAPAVQLTSGADVPLDAELIRIDATFTVGDVLV